MFATLRMTLTLGLSAAFLPRRTKLILRQANDLSADFAVLVKSSLVKHRLARQLTITALRQADAVVCQSDAMRTDLKGLLGSKVPLHVIGNPVDVAAVRRSATSRTVELAGTPSLVTVGRLAPQKGHDLLLHALVRVRETHPGVHLTIVGDGPDRAALEQLARTLGIEANVTFAGFVAEPLPLVNAADLFVLCSRYEGFANAVLEALACGKPVAVTDCPGANSQIVRSLNGELSAIDATDFAAAVLRALARPFDSRAIVEDIDARFGGTQIIDAYQDLFERTAGHA